MRHTIAFHKIRHFHDFFICKNNLLIFFCFGFEMTKFINNNSLFKSNNDNNNNNKKNYKVTDVVYRQNMQKEGQRSRVLVQDLKTKSQTGHTPLHPKKFTNQK